MPHESNTGGYRKEVSMVRVGLVMVVMQNAALVAQEASGARLILTGTKLLNAAICTYICTQTGCGHSAKTTSHMTAAQLVPTRPLSVVCVCVLLVPQLTCVTSPLSSVNILYSLNRAMYT